MATTKNTQPNPSNRELMDAFIKFQQEDAAYKKSTIEPLVKEISGLKQWKRETEIAQKAAENAVDKYIKSHPITPALPVGGEQWLNRELVKALIIALGIISAIITLGGKFIN